MESYLRLSEVDKQILHSHALMLDGLGNFFGSTHEVILHSLENLESSAIKVIHKIKKIFLILIKRNFWQNYLKADFIFQNSV